MYKKIINLVCIICVLVGCFGCKSKVDKELDKLQEKKDEPKVTEVKEKNEVVVGDFDPDKIIKIDEVREKLKMPITKYCIITTKYAFAENESKREIPEKVLKEFLKYADIIPIASSDIDCKGFWELSVLEQHDNVKVPVITYFWRTELDRHGVIIPNRREKYKEYHKCTIEIKTDLKDKIKKVNIYRDDINRDMAGQGIKTTTLLLLEDDGIKDNAKIPTPQSSKYTYNENLVKSLEEVPDGKGIPVIPDAVIKEFEIQADKINSPNIWKLNGPVKDLKGNPFEHFVWITELEHHGDKEKHWGIIEIVTDKDYKDVSYVRVWKKHILGEKLDEFYDDVVFEKVYKEEFNEKRKKLDIPKLRLE